LHLLQQTGKSTGAVARIAKLTGHHSLKKQELLKSIFEYLYDIH